MGDDIRPDRALTIEVMLAIQSHYAQLYELTQSLRERLAISCSCTFFVVEFCAGLRGEELPMMSLDAIRRYYGKPQKANLEHVMLGLRGRIKGEYKDEHCHLIPIAAVTRSGLEPHKWVGRVLELYGEQGIRGGWMFRGEGGQYIRQKALEPELFEVLREIQREHPEWIDPTEDVGEVYGISRSMRRGYTTHATNVNVGDADITRLARWRNLEAADGKSATHGGMKQHYSEITQMLKSLLRATQRL
jgi:hypothetical protein